MGASVLDKERFERECLEIEKASAASAIEWRWCTGRTRPSGIEESGYLIAQVPYRSWRQALQTTVEETEIASGLGTLSLAAPEQECGEEITYADPTATAGHDSPIEAHVVFHSTYSCPVLFLSRSPPEIPNNGRSCHGRELSPSHPTQSDTKTPKVACDNLSGPMGHPRSEDDSLIPDYSEIGGGETGHQGHEPPVLGFDTHPRLSLTMRVVHPCETGSLLHSMALACPGSEEFPVHAWLLAVCDYVGIIIDDRIAMSPWLRQNGTIHQSGM